MNYVFKIALFSILSVCSMLATAQCRDPGQTRTSKVYSERVNVSTARGDAIAEVAYSITAYTHACESGNAIGIDTRKCQFVNLTRTLVRTITLTPPGGSPIELGTKTEVEPVYPVQYFSSNCNAHAEGANIGEWVAYLSDSLGTATSWKPVIDNDRAQVLNILSLIGAVKGTT